MKLTLQELADLTGGKIVRSGAISEFAGMGALDEAEQLDVSFLGNEKYHQDYLETEAGVVLIPLGIASGACPCDSVALVEVENPSLAFAQVVKHFVTTTRDFIPGVAVGAIVADDATLDISKVCIKAGAIVESGAVIGDGSEVGAGSVVGAGVQVGKDCLIHANATIREQCILGDRVILQPGCVIGSDGYGYELIDGKHVKVDQVGIVVLENDVEIGANTTIDRARFGKTVIGEGSKIDNLVQIAHNVRIGKHCLVVAQSGMAGSSTLGNYVTLAAQAGVGGHIKIHDRAVLTAQTGALKDLKGDMVYKGMPARPLREEQKKLAHIARLPKLAQEVKNLRARLDQLESGQSSE
ncbi:MAG: UDP-3-O-(3-hydroxymyristoyl)glucosamine N-acyltransferase [Akkermansiaceae bacterium]|nr:UDP-3-O-(3-hydroxymyristoyl)glucosamine N-acyltransferase [Akkermansiaceae bacterium]